MTFWQSMASRRQWFRRAGQGLLAGGVLPSLAGRMQLAAAPVPARGATNLYERIGVKPFVNCKGTYTILSGSQTLAEVKAAMDEASRHYVHLDELMDGVGARLAELTKAPWGIVTAGCAAALTHATAACVAGSNPEKMQRLPQLDGLKNEVVMPRPSRNVYDHAIRMIGVNMVTPETAEEFHRALQPSVAMVALLGETIERHPVPLDEMCRAAHERGIPIIVDAAAERLTIPNSYLAKGVDMVAYSGGKCLRGPQSAGLLLGRKDLLQAAWINSAPHHAFGRSLKVDKEDIMGMLAAVEAWVKRDHDAEWKEWESWLDIISKEATKVATVETKVIQPDGPSNYAPRLQITWDTAKVGITGNELSDHLMSTSPRIMIPPNRQGVGVMPYMMMPGDAPVVAKRLHEVLSNPPKKAPESPSGAEVSVAGQWDVEVAYLLGRGQHSLYLEQKGSQILGSHHGEFLSGDVRGSVEGGKARFRSNHRFEGTSIGYTFEGVLENGVLRGKVDLGEYGTADFTARRHFKA